MAEEFGNVMKNLWSGKYNWTNANQLRVRLKIIPRLSQTSLSELCREKTSRIYW